MKKHGPLPIRRRLVALMGCVAGVLMPVAASARDFTVKMRTQGSGGMMVFEPAYVSAAVGDTVTFVPTDPGHNAAPIGGMAPAGVALSGGAVNKPYVLTLSKPGLYGIKCTPHFAMGMVALVKAGGGPASNAGEAAAVVLPPLAAKRMAPLLAAAR